MKIFHALFALLFLCVLLFAAGTHGRRDSSKTSHQLANTLIYVRAESFASAVQDNFSEAHLRDVSVAASIAARASPQEEQDLSDHIFHKAMFSWHDSHASSALPSLRSLGAQKGDKQFYVLFSTRSDIRTLLALQHFTGRRIVAHVEGGLYVAIGGSSFAAKARRFPGVAWVQEREGKTKLGNRLQQTLQKTMVSTKERSVPFSRNVGDAFTEIVAECWYDGCAEAAAAVRALCSDVYVHPTLVEAHCASEVLASAAAALSEHIGVDHIDIKSVTTFANFGGRAIIGTGSDASTPQASRVLSSINVSGSLIAVADTGIDMNNCFFYDSRANVAPWNNSRVVQSYNVMPCEICGRCCGRQSGPNCTNASNTCGNFIDESAHGTHVSGTVAGVGPDHVSYGNGIAAGAKLFFQDFENFANDTVCYAPGMCMKLTRPTDIQDLFLPAYNAGARVHSNSWGTLENAQYNKEARGIDAFVSAHPTFLVLLAAGNAGRDAALGTVYGSATCKNCLSVGASQQSDALFRSMQPYVDDGEYCFIVGMKTGACLDSVNRCCIAMLQLNMSLPCCANQTNCGNSADCSIRSGNLRSPTNVAATSSRGPSLDGRYKPDLIAPGEDILSAATPAQMTPGNFTPTSPDHCVVPSQARPRTEQEDFNRALKLASGTSMATPLTAGAVEKIRQYFAQGYYPAGKIGMGMRFEPAEALVRAVVLASCRSSAYDPSWAVWSQTYPPPIFPNFFRYPIPSSSSPNFYHGFGLPVLDQAVYMADSGSNYRMFYTDGTYSTGSSPSAFTIACDSTQSIPLTVVLVWTDPPSSLGSQRQLVNDLDLIVVVPGDVPSQLFGNMRTYADQLNTVERVITRCPVAGTVTAIVALGDSLKSASQKWYLVANGPVTSDIAPTLVPPYASGRLQALPTQSQPCYSDAAIFTTVKFKSAAAWTCFGTPWDCSVREWEVETALALILGVASQAIQVNFKPSEPGAISIILQCSAMINSWHDATSTILKYVNSTMLLSGLRRASDASYGDDSVLSAFNWTTLMVDTISPEVTITVTSFTDSGCKNMSAGKPMVFNNRYCSFGAYVVNPLFTGQVYLKAVSCGEKAAYQLSLNPDRCNGRILHQDINKCTADIFDDPAKWVIYSCTPRSAPPVSPSPKATSSATSLAIIVGCSVGGTIVGKTTDCTDCSIERITLPLRFHVTSVF